MEINTHTMLWELNGDTLSGGQVGKDNNNNINSWEFRLTVLRPGSKSLHVLSHTHRIATNPVKVVVSIPIRWGRSHWPMAKGVRPTWSHSRACVLACAYNIWTCCDSGILLLGIYPKKTMGNSKKLRCTRTLTAATVLKQGKGNNVNHQQ